MTFDPISFEVEGIPAPQGSKTAIQQGGRARVIEGSSRTGRAAHRAWRQAVHDAAADIAGDSPIDEPVSVTVTFRFPMPQSRSAVVRRTGWAWRTAKPDLSKIMRSTEDSLVTAGLLRDDARIVRAVIEKVELSDTWHGAEITVEPAGDWL